MSPTCNATLEDMSLPAHQKAIVGNFTFNEMAQIVGAGTTLIAVVLSLTLMWLHAMNYTKPREQRHILRILFMVPVYSIASLCQIRWYTHAVYIEVLATCYEAFALAAFFALVCHYVAPDVHTQKIFFREMTPIKPWIFPLSLFARCCGGQRGIWRTPRSGLTWFNICWISVYQYCFFRIASTIVAVVTEALEIYCESSNSPAFAHIWVSAINMVAVSIAMLCIVQVYVQLKDPLAEQKLFSKILAIKLVVFLVFWQTVLLSLGTSTINIIHTTATVSYPDIKVGIPNLLICVEMAFFAIFHFWAYPHRPYVPGAPTTFYPAPDANSSGPYTENKHEPPRGGFLGIMGFIDALNPWDLVKAFARGVRWLACGVKRRKDDISYANSTQLNSRPTSANGDRWATTGSDSFLKPTNPSNDNDIAPVSTYGSGDYPVTEYERYEPMRSNEERFGRLQTLTPQPYDAGTFNSAPSAPQPPPYGYGSQTAYRPYMSQDTSPYSSDLETSSQAPVQPSGPLNSHKLSRGHDGGFI